MRKSAWDCLPGAGYFQTIMLSNGSVMTTCLHHKPLRMFNAGVRPSRYSFFKFNYVASVRFRVRMHLFNIHTHATAWHLMCIHTHTRFEYVAARHKNIQANQADIMFVALWVFCRFASHCKFHQHNANMKRRRSKIDDAYMPHKHAGALLWMRRRAWLLTLFCIIFLIQLPPACVVELHLPENNSERAHA